MSIYKISTNGIQIYCTINDHELCLVFVNKRDQYIFMWRIPAPFFQSCYHDEVPRTRIHIQIACADLVINIIKNGFQIIDTLLYREEKTRQFKKKTHKKSVFKLFNISECYFRWLPISIVQPFLALCLLLGNASRYFSSVFARTL